MKRCHRESQLWIDGNFIGSNLNLIPYICFLSSLNPGKYSIILRIDNSEKVNIDRIVHSVSEQTAGTWNGIVGKLSLEDLRGIAIENGEPERVKGKQELLESIIYQYNFKK